MEFRILGPLEVLDEAGERVTLPGNRERVLLALLLLSANRVMSSGHLADGLWGDRPPDGWAHALQVHISRLRRALRQVGGDGLLVTRSPGYLMRIDPAAVDATRFEALLSQGRQQAAMGDPHQAAVTFRDALDLWRGPALADVLDAPPARAEATRLEEARVAALEERVEADLVCGRHGQLVAELEALTRTHPLRERLWGQRMVALYRAGRQADALRAYQELRSALGEGLGLEPSSTLRHLESAILRHEPELDWRPEASGPPARAIPMPVLLTEIGRIFVGREQELKQLDALWADAERGLHRLVLLSGEPGVGKTRLAAEFARRANGEGATVLAGRCDEDLGVPYQPFVEALRHFVDHTPGPLLAAGLGRQAGELVRIHPDLAGRLPDLAPPMRSDPETERYRLFEAVASWLAASSADHPILLVLDDLQWATKPTLLLLRHVMRSAEPLRLLIVGAYRDTELGHGHPLVDMLADIRHQAGMGRLSLVGLDEGEVARFLEQAAGHELDDEGLTLARIVHSETDGNPFFVREILRHLTESGDIERRDGRWAARLPLEELGVPEGVRAVVGRRLARLSDAANRVLRVAAVVGAEFDLSLVGAVCDLDEEPLLSALDEAIAAHLIAEASGPALRYQFAHALVRDTLYGDLSAARRVVAHRKVAEAIETLYTALDDQLPALAYHWARAAAPTAETERAVEYATRAGDRALAQLAHDEAAAYYASALDLLDAAGMPADDHRRLELLISQGEAQRRAADPGYRQTLLDAAHLAIRLGDASALARAALANTMGNVWTGIAVIDTERVETLEAAIAAVGEDELPLRSRLMATLGLELAWEDDPRRRLTLSEEALRIARSLADPGTLAHVLLARDYTITAPENAHERLTASSEVLAIAARLGDPIMASRALSLRVKAALELADVPEAERCLATNQALVADLGQPTLTWATMHQHATLRVLRGDPDAEAAISAAHDYGVSVDRPGIDILALLQRLPLYLAQGRLGELDEIFRQILEARPTPLGKGLYAHILAETGQMEAAAGLFDELAATGFAHPTNNVAWLRFAVDCAWVCARLGRGDCVPPLRSRLEPHADQLVVTSFAGEVSGSVAFYLGLLATTTGDWQDAEASFTDAAATHDRIRAPAWLARTRLEWARMLLARAEPGDGERVGELLHEALAAARELGLANIERTAIELLSQ